MSVPLLLLLFAAAGEGPARYARPELLMEAADLAKAPAKGLRILDARPRAKYAAGHIPGAVWVDHAAWSKLLVAGADREKWMKEIGALGIDVITPVVVYDDGPAKEAARVWWILRYWGVKDVRLLNGGWAAWQTAKAPVAKEETKPTPVTPSLAAQRDRLATKNDVLELLKGKDYQIIDARSPGEFCGDVAMAKRGGAIPGAVNLEWSELIDKSSQRFKGPGELAELLKKAGVKLDRPSVTYCQSGGRAAVMMFALELMGARDVRNYYRSWAEWGNDPATPIVKPKN